MLNYDPDLTDLCVTKRICKFRKIIKSDITLEVFSALTPEKK